ncbi:MAG: phospho-N-acetylmuramoyl-pentapeptide-transferase [bacterium]
MFYYLHTLSDATPWLRLFRYITFRAALGAATAFLLCLLLAPFVIRTLRRLKIGQVVRADEADAPAPPHAGKKGTPTMGGILIVFSVVVSTLLWSVPSNIFVALTLTTMVLMGMIGFFDDRAKLLGRHSRGVRARTKFWIEVAWGIVVTGVLLLHPATSVHARELMVPFCKAPVVADMGVLLTGLFVTLIIVGATNAVNLTDGLDGLAIGCTGSVATTYLIMAYVAGNVTLAKYLLVPYVPGSGELVVFCACLLGGSLGFLWYNCHPAQVFMGDTGSLALGGAIAMVAISIKQELVLVLVGGVFVMEAVSVILQVASFRLRGKRIFAMAPIHHHFELRKWSETQVTIRFWILSILCALLGLATLKIR